MAAKTFPPCPADPTPASFKTDLLANAKPISEVSKASGTTYLRRKNYFPEIIAAREEQGENI